MKKKKKKKLEIPPAVFIWNNTANHAITYTILEDTSLVLAYAWLTSNNIYHYFIITTMTKLYH